MSRLFITQREIDFINDIGKEVVKDVVGQKIYFFPISKIKSDVHDVYEESPNKVFDNPIEIEALVKYQPQDIRSNLFGSEEYYTIEVYIQKKDLNDRGIQIREGDFFSYGSVFFEVVQVPDSSTIYGEIEFKSFVTITGKQSRKGQFISKVFGPTSEMNSDSDAVQDTFVQQRGLSANRLGETADSRDLQKKGVLEKPISGPSEVSPRGDNTGAGSSFYDED
ncbi:hypothetical protein CMI47_06890 [Candidatus Pacearchaeota archaeon]|nr:hypothetical protein [Candidatus Pacearchaeota archaeon]